MTFEAEILVRVALCLFGIAGYLVARHIHIKKFTKKPVVCPMRMNCHKVVHSDYSKFMGVPLEIYGMTYYLLIGLSYLLLIFVPGVLPFTFVSVLVVFSIGAFVFSVYLIFVQLVILKEGCFWCFVSAFISTLIFILTISAYHLVSAVSILVK